MKSIQGHYHRSKICLHLHLFSQIFWEGSHQGKNHGSTSLTAPVGGNNHEIFLSHLGYSIRSNSNHQFSWAQAAVLLHCFFFFKSGFAPSHPKNTVAPWFKGFPLSACGKACTPLVTFAARTLERCTLWTCFFLPLGMPSFAGPCMLVF